MSEVTEAQLLADICRESYAEFVKTFWHTVVRDDLMWNWHIDVMCDELQAMCERVFKWQPKEYDIVTNIPPGSSKSTVHSVMLVPWCWTRMPHFVGICASYSEDLALDLALKCRDVVKSELYRALYPEVRIRHDQDTKSTFANTNGGIRYGVGAGGTVSGKHAHAIIIDDPLDPNKAISDAEIDAANHWVGSTLPSRKKNELITFTALVMQRLHQDDPAAQMLRNGRVRHIRLPALSDYTVHPPELKKYYVDGLMDPARLTRDVLEAKRKQQNGEYIVAAQYNQDPVPLGGGTFKTDRLRYDNPPDKFKHVVRFWDKAVSLKKRAAFTAGVLVAEDGLGRIWVLDVIRGRWDSARREQIIKRTAMRDGRLVVVGVEQEGGSSGVDSAAGTVSRLKGWRVRVVPARANKELRADEFSVQVNNGNVYMPARFRVGTSWVGWARDYVEEMRYWPNSTYKDQVDASAHAFGIITRGSVRVGPLRKKRGEGAGLVRHRRLA